VGKPKRNSLEDLGVDGEMILKMYLKEIGLEVC
jgi:hypothetical protein